MGVSVEQWHIRIGSFMMPRKCKIQLKTLKLKSVSLSIQILLFYMLLAEGVEANPGPQNGGNPGCSGGLPQRGRGGQSPRGHGRGARGGRGSRDWDQPVDIFADVDQNSRDNRGSQRYDLRRPSRSETQPSVSSWLLNSQQRSQSEPRLDDLQPPSNVSTRSDTELASQTSEPNLNDNLNKTDTASILLEIRRDVKNLNTKFDHLEKSVQSLKRDSKFLKDQNSILTKQVTDLQSTVSQLESRAQEAEIRNERLEAQSRRDNLRFYGFEDKQGETWEESENKVRSYIVNDLNIEESSIQIERAHRIPSKTSPRPLIVKFSFYKDRDRVLKAYREKRKRQNEQSTGATGASAAEQIEQSETCRIRVCEDFPERLIKARSNLCSFLRSSIDSGRDGFLRYDRLIVDGQPYQYDYDQKRPVPIRK